MEVSDEINTCSVEVKLDVNGVKEPWLTMFKWNPTQEVSHLVERLLVSVGWPIVESFLRLQAMHLGAGDITTPISGNSRW